MGVPAHLDEGNMAQLETGGQDLSAPALRITLALCCQRNRLDVDCLDSIACIKALMQ